MALWEHCAAVMKMSPVINTVSSKSPKHGPTPATVKLITLPQLKPAQSIIVVMWPWAIMNATRQNLLDLVAVTIIQG